MSSPRSLPSAAIGTIALLLLTSPAALVLGKYLTPRLYVQYGVGVFDAVSTLRIEYLLSKKWTVRAEVGEGTGADVLYTIER